MVFDVEHLSAIGKSDHAVLNFKFRTHVTLRVFYKRSGFLIEQITNS